MYIYKYIYIYFLYIVSLVVILRNWVCDTNWVYQFPKEV